MAARGGGPVIMEHLFLEVAAAPLRLIAAKNEKSRSELGRFLVKQVRGGAGGKELGRPPHPPPPGACPMALREDARDRGAASCHSGPLPKAGQGRGVRARLRSLEGAFCFSVGESSLLSTDLFPWSILAMCAKRNLQRKTWFWGVFCN